MPALSKKQQKFFGIVRAIQKGEQSPTTPETAKAAADMKKSDVKKFASTKHKGLPEKKVTKEELDKNDKPFVKHLVKKLRSGSKTHAKQADDLEKAVNEESNPRIPRKKGQPANSKKHSRKKENFKAWVQSKITKASDYLDTAADYLDSKEVKEAANPAQQAAIAIDMKKKGKKPKGNGGGLTAKQKKLPPALQKAILKSKTKKKKVKKAQVVMALSAATKKTLSEKAAKVGAHIFGKGKKPKKKTTKTT